MSTTPLKTQTQPENRQEENIEKRISGQVDYRVIFLFFFFFSILYNSQCVSSHFNNGSGEGKLIKRGKMSPIH